jgi:RNA polymerase sigma-70 factor (ECF subfamily)
MHDAKAARSRPPTASRPSASVFVERRSDVGGSAKRRRLRAPWKLPTIPRDSLDLDGFMADPTDIHPADPDRLRDLLVATAGGDAGAFEQLYRSTSPKLFGICLRIVQQRSDAEDVLQDVYVTIWRKAAQFDAARASAITWLAMMARNKAIDRLRAGGVERNSAPIDLAEDLQDPNAATLVLAETHEQMRRLDACLGELEVQRRNLIRVAFFEGATYEELAARCSAPLGTVKSWIRRGLLRLKACLER